MVTKDVHVKTVLLFVCAAVFAAGADASLYNDPAAMTGFTGRASFDISQSGSSLRVDVEYAVYAPGTYPGIDLTGGSQYIYAYQVFNSNRSNVAVDFFSVEIISGASADLIYADDTYGSGIEPSSSHIFAQSAGFVFAAQNLDPRKWSDVLIFSSVHSPTTGVGTINGGGLCGMEVLATPSAVPEPATILFIVPGLLISTNRKRHLSASKTGCRKIVTIK
ncbi:MAG: hypothetical protein A2173_08190 [Planctomycetes bacterium RBG_13_44_8b]|nr:MAG: hypothetical protein A2173_08190 [Planctomycetes bacterium RBG_13_44_8b]